MQHTWFKILLLLQLKCTDSYIGLQFIVFKPFKEVFCWSDIILCAYDKM